MSENTKNIHISDVLGCQLDWLSNHKGEMYGILTEDMYTSQLAMARLARSLTEKGLKAEALEVMQTAVTLGPLVVFDPNIGKIRVADTIGPEDDDYTTPTPELDAPPRKLH